MENIKILMKNEGYSDKDIQIALNQGNGGHNTLLLKAIRRMQHFNEELNTKPKMFDRWR
jgi:hypothetical protein